MTDEISGKPRVPVGELEELVGLWRGMAEQHNVPESNATSLQFCADELEALIEGYDYE